MRLRRAASQAPPPPRLRAARSFDTPLWFDEQQLGQLRGTALAAAATTHARVLRTQWERLRPALVEMLARVGVFEPPRFEEWLWAYSAFWSRGQSLPVPVCAGGVGGGGAGGGQSDAPLEIREEQDPPGAGGGSSGSSSGGGSSSSSGGGGSESSGGGEVQRVVVLEGIVPGIDFANHSTQVRWRVGCGAP